MDTKGRQVARPPEEAEADNAERWLLTYADLITLLLAFFIIMYAVSRADLENFQKVATQLSKAFNVDVLQSHNSTSAFATSEIPSLLGGLSGVGATLGEELVSFAEKEKIGDQISVEASADGVVIRMAGAFVFTSGAAEIRPVAKRALEAIALQIGNVDNLVRVEGHTDNIPTSAQERFESNLDLSLSRAGAVLQHLLDEGNIEAKRLTASGYGDTLPIADNETPQGRMKNRRTDIWILPEDHSEAVRRARMAVEQS